MRVGDVRVRIEKALRRRLGRRRFHAYGVGAAKTGTTTVSGMLRRHYLAAHEPETIATNRLVIGYLEGDRTLSDIREALTRRDRRLSLEMDSSHPLGYVAPILQDLFPKARFVVTLREPMSWLRSRVHFHQRTDPPKWREYRSYFWFREEREYLPEEEVLRKHGLAPLHVYLRQYARHCRIVLHELDPARRLVLKTAELSSSAPALARFLGIPEDTVVVTHGKRAHPGVDLMSKLDEGFVQAQVSEHFGELLAHWFPTVSGSDADGPGTRPPTGAR